ncbi:9072_t:CDS:2 [Entrophospora sp. SA101]|nr:9072_t:CDS:2 [Entrophospora sp. SA101]
MLSKVNIGPQLLLIFNNGRFEQFFESVNLTKEEMKDEEISRKIAAYMFKLHNIVTIFPPDNIENIVPEVWSNIDQWFQLAWDIINSDSSDSSNNVNIERFDLELLKKEIKELKSILQMVDSPIVFAHNDCQYGNILRLTDGSNQLAIIDLEYSGWNHRGFDIGNHLCEWTFDYHSTEPHVAHLDWYPNEQQQRTETLMDTKILQNFADMPIELFFKKNQLMESTSMPQTNDHNDSSLKFFNNNDITNLKKVKKSNSNNPIGHVDDLEEQTAAAAAQTLQLLKLTSNLQNDGDYHDHDNVFNSDHQINYDNHHINGKNIILNSDCYLNNHDSEGSNNGNDAADGLSRKNILEHHPIFFNADIRGLTDKISQSQHDSTRPPAEQQRYLNISLGWNKPVDTALLHSVAVRTREVERELLPLPTISAHTNSSLPNSSNVFNPSKNSQFFIPTSTLSFSDSQAFLMPTTLYNLKSHQCTHSKDRPYKCLICELAFARNHDLKRHQKIHDKIGCSQTSQTKSKKSQHMSNDIIRIK